MDLPVVNHEDYFAKIGDDHKFPINKFGELAKYLIKNNIVKKFHKPFACSEKTLKRAHSEIYIKNVVNKTLDQLTIKKIGFPDFEVDMLKLNKVIKTSEFKNMQVLEKKEDFKEAVIDPKSKTRKVFFKFGPKNDWKRILNKEFKEKIEKAFSKEMEELGYL